jgi:signal transduction histidine kinase
VTRFTVRVRLAALLVVLLIVSGAGLLAISYELVSASLNSSVPMPSRGAAGATVVRPGGHPAAGSVPSSSVSGPRLLPAGTQQRFVVHALHRLVAQYVAVLAGVVLIALALGWLLAGRVLRPLRRVTAAARRVSGSNLTERIALDGPHDELHELSDTFDGMLERLDAAFSAQRRFIADASHELRTPLAVMRTEIEVLVENPTATAQNVEAASATLQRQLRRGVELIDSLLTLATSEPELLEREPVDLDELVREVIADASAQAMSRGIQIGTELYSAPLDGDHSLLARLVANLVSNAIKHNREGGWIEARTETNGGSAILVVANSGSPIRPEDIEELRRAFRRGGTARTGDGHGLGLAIADAVTHAHDGELALEPLHEGGLRVTATFNISRDRSHEQPGATSQVSPPRTKAPAPVPGPQRQEPRSGRL